MAQGLSIRALSALSLLGLLAGVGCHISDYPVITDDRGDYSGVVRTGHKAYIERLYSFNNYDPTASVIYLDQTYCDWQYEGCPPAKSWNPVQNDEPFDLEDDLYDFDCSGARSLCVWVAMTTRIRRNTLRKYSHARPRGGARGPTCCRSMRARLTSGWSPRMVRAGRRRSSATPAPS